ncbi:Conserved protein of unknown function (part 1) [Mycobacterium canettii CIPT 140070010]|nr:Conserved protein of unknown function (part 1) [Mycobacterium canettii CIPT 140070010]
MRDRREQQNLVGRHGETLLAEAAFTSVSYRRCTCAAMLDAADQQHVVVESRRGSPGNVAVTNRSDVDEVRLQYVHARDSDWSPQLPPVS